MIPYNQQIDPPAPFLQIIAANRFDHRKRVALPALLDTGSDFTAIPGDIVDRLSTLPNGSN